MAIKDKIINSLTGSNIRTVRVSAPQLADIIYGCFVENQGNNPDSIARLLKGKFFFPTEADSPDGRFHLYISYFRRGLTVHRVAWVKRYETEEIFEWRGYTLGPLKKAFRETITMKQVTSFMGVGESDGTDIFSQFSSDNEISEASIYPDEPERSKAKHSSSKKNRWKALVCICVVLIIALYILNKAKVILLSPQEISQYYNAEKFKNDYSLRVREYSESVIGVSNVLLTVTDKGSIKSIYSNCKGPFRFKGVTCGMGKSQVINKLTKEVDEASKLEEREYVFSFSRNGWDYYYERDLDPLRRSYTRYIVALYFDKNDILKELVYFWYEDEDAKKEHQKIIDGTYKSPYVGRELTQQEMKHRERLAEKEEEERQKLIENINQEMRRSIENLATGDKNQVSSAVTPTPTQLENDLSICIGMDCDEAEKKFDKSNGNCTIRRDNKTHKVQAVSSFSAKYTIYGLKCGDSEENVPSGGFDLDVASDNIHQVGWNGKEIELYAHYKNEELGQKITVISTGGKICEIHLSTSL